MKEMQHGRDYNGERIDGWIATEKMDGIRLFWDGSRAWSKEGNEIALSPAFRASLPRGFAVEGELHCGRGGLNKAHSLYKSGTVDDRLTFTIFDAPISAGGWLDRIATIPACGHEVVEHTILRDFEHALELYAEITEKDGEGAMLRDPSMLYTPGRTRGLLKLKTVPVEWADHFADMCCA